MLLANTPAAAAAPAQTLTAQTSSAPGTSLAETVLAQAQAVEAAAKGAAKSAPSTKAQSTPPGASQPAAGSAQAEAQVASDAADAIGDVKAGKLSWNDALKRVPPDVASLMRSMQADYTRKTQELSRAQKEALAERESLLKGAAALKTKELPEYDPFNESTVQARIENEVSRRLAEVLKPMQDEYEVKAAEDQYNSFLSENPDFKSDAGLRSEVQRMLESNPSLDLETAYWAAKGRGAKLAAAKAKADAEAEAKAGSARRRANQAAANTATSPARRGPAADVATGTKVGRSTSNESILAMARAKAGQ